jgi:6-pyruvoyltetrahydropterin/6-carboxytetrahydropterin synthase
MSEQIFHVVTARFEAARRVAILPQGHPSRRLHGHSFLARVRAELPATWAPFPGASTDALTQALQQTVSGLDYRDLNEQLPIPTDENLARWVWAQLEVPGIESVGIQSTTDQGVDLDPQDHAHIWRRFRFEAAHRLPNVPGGHPCGRMHGHGFEVILHADQDVTKQDMGVDFDTLGTLWEPLHAQLDCACLNDIAGLETPTSELLAAWIWQRLKPEFDALSWVTVYETVTAGCHYNGAQYRIWKEQRFESALRLTQAPAGDKRRQLHGHSYQLRLHLTAPLDEVMGWTVDYGDVKERFKPVYKQLDHHLLNDLPHLSDTDPANLSLWIREAVAPTLPQLDRIDLHQTPGCGAVLCWGSEGPALPT